jgi:hypothetical protein
MKNDSTTTFLNLVLAALVFLGVLFALLSIWRMHELRDLQQHLQKQALLIQGTLPHVEALVNDTAAYNTTAKSPELTQLLQALHPVNVPAHK